MQRGFFFLERGWVSDLFGKQIIRAEGESNHALGEQRRWMRKLREMPGRCGTYWPLEAKSKQPRVVALEARLAVNVGEGECSGEG